MPNSKATFVCVCVYNRILRVSGSTTNAITFDWKLFMYSHPAFFSSFSFILNALCTFAFISTVLAFIWRPFEMVDHPSASISASLTNPYLLFNWATQSSSQPWNERATSFLRKQLPWWKHRQWLHVNVGVSSYRIVSVVEREKTKNLVWAFSSDSHEFEFYCKFIGVAGNVELFKYAKHWAPSSN